MSYKLFLGVDVSKDTLDCCIHEKALHRQFRNSSKGFERILGWINKTIPSVPMDDVLIAFEHTGMYSLPLAFFLQERGIAFCMIPALQIKRSLGIARGKSDKIDARRIAAYAYLYRESLEQTKLPPRTIMKLHPLLTLRSRLVSHRAGHIATSKEQKRFLRDLQVEELEQIHKGAIDRLTVQIRQLDESILKMIRSDKELSKTFDLVTSVKGIGPVIGAYFIVYTQNFTRFDCWRKFACYAGIVPFENQSGKMHKRNQVSQLANKQMKKLLHLAAMIARHSDTEIKLYFLRKQEEGKPNMAIMNAIRNKIVARVFAVVSRGTPYVTLMRHTV